MGVQFSMDGRMNLHEQFASALFRALCIVLVLLQVFPVAAQESSPPSGGALNTQAQKIADQVKALPIGGKLTVIKTDGTEYHGRLLAIRSQDFTVEEVDLKQPISFAYADVARVTKNYGGKGFGGKRVNPKTNRIVVAILIGTVVTILTIALAKDKS